MAGSISFALVANPISTPLTSFGKIVQSTDKDWLDFFSENDGMVVVHMTGMKEDSTKGSAAPVSRAPCSDPSVVLRHPRRQMHYSGHAVRDNRA